MLDNLAVIETISLYNKHGWTLRRVLLTEDSKQRLNAPATVLFGPAEVRDSDLDALWFSRRSRPDAESWELRRLTGTPFALFETVPDGTAPEELESFLNDVEMRMIDSKWTGTDGL